MWKKREDTMGGEEKKGRKKKGVERIGGEKKTAVNQGRGNKGHRRTFKLYSEYQTTTKLTIVPHQIKRPLSQDKMSLI